MHSRWLGALILSSALAGPALAADRAQSSKELFQLFSDACIANRAAPDGVKAWADDHHLEAVQSAGALQTFAGGDGGAVWEAKMPSSAFALAVRASGGACAVYGDKLDVAVVESLVKGFADELKSAGRRVVVVKDDESGAQHNLIYLADGPAGKLTLAMIVNDKPGGAFQATIQLSGPGSSRGSGG
jgi:hypothetical protein